MLKIETANAPAAIGPYSQAIQAGDTLYISGQLPIDPATGAFPSDEITAQTEQSLKNMAAILEEAGMTMANIVKTTVLLADIADFGAMNEVYAKFFTGTCPARAAFQVGTLPKAAKVEIEAVAVKYPCDFFALDQWKLGSIQDHTIEELLGSNKAKEFAQQRKDPPSECFTCPYKALCRTGCFRDWEKTNGAFHNHYCESFKTLFAYVLPRLLEVTNAEIRSRKPR